MEAAFVLLNAEMAAAMFQSGLAFQRPNSGMCRQSMVQLEDIVSAARRLQS